MTKGRKGVAEGQQVVPAELVSRFAALFHGYTQAHGTFTPKKVDIRGKLTGQSATVHETVTASTYAAHLCGRVSIGVIPLLDDSTNAVFGAIDYDNRKMDHVKADARIRELGLPLVLCRSKSGGGHFYCFSEHPVSATVMREKLTEWAGQLGMSAKTEIFPKQVKREPDEVGTFINLPYFGGERFALIKGNPATLGEFLDYAEACRVDLGSAERDDTGDNEIADVVEDGERNTTLTSLAGTLRRRGLDAEIIEITLAAVNERRCDPPLDADEVAKIARSVAKYSPAPQAAPLQREHSLFPPGSEHNRPGTSAHIHALNDRFAVVTDEGRTLIWRPVRDEGRIVYERFREQDFRLHLKNRTVEVPVGKDRKGNAKIKEVPLADYWLTHPHRRDYQHVTFDPTPGFTAPRGTLNLWRGFSVAPAPGRWDRFDAHLREVLCAEVEERYRYLRLWLARSAQYPHKHGEVATVLRGAKGAGKGIFGNALVSLHGQHGLRIDNALHLTGRFNSHLRDCCFLFVDEGHWAGDKAGESTLKGLITESRLVVEAKYANAVPVRNRLTILMASNSDWVVPASRDERRYFVLDVADTKVGNWAYFAAIRDELAHGGLAAFLHDMLAEDITGFNHRNVPITEALQDQVIRSTDPLERWWFERLEDGEPLGELRAPGRRDEEVEEEVDAAVKGTWVHEAVMVQKDALHVDYLRWCDRHRIKNTRDTRKMLGWALKRWLPPGWPQDTWVGGPRALAEYRLPPLEACRTAFARGRAGMFTAIDQPVTLSEAETKTVLFRNGRSAS